MVVVRLRNPSDNPPYAVTYVGEPTEYQLSTISLSGHKLLQQAFHRVFGPHFRRKPLQPSGKISLVKMLVRDDNRPSFELEPRNWCAVRLQCGDRDGDHRPGL